MLARWCGGRGGRGGTLVRCGGGGGGRGGGTIRSSNSSSFNVLSVSRSSYPSSSTSFSEYWFSLHRCRRATTSFTSPAWWPGFTVTAAASDAASGADGGAGEPSGIGAERASGWTGPESESEPPLGGGGGAPIWPAIIGIAADAPRARDPDAGLFSCAFGGERARRPLPPSPPPPLLPPSAPPLEPAAAPFPTPLAPSTSEIVSDFGIRCTWKMLGCFSSSVNSPPQSSRTCTSDSFPRRDLRVLATSTAFSERPSAAMRIDLA